MKVDLRVSNFTVAFSSFRVEHTLFVGAHIAGASSLDCSLRTPGANLSGCDLRGLNLAGIDLTGADLRNANLSHANVSGTILANTQLSGLRSGAVVGVPSSLPMHWFVLSGYLLGPYANASGAILRNATITGKTLTSRNS